MEDSFHLDRSFKTFQKKLRQNESVCFNSKGLFRRRSQLLCINVVLLKTNPTDSIVQDVKGSLRVRGRFHFKKIMLRAARKRVRLLFDAGHIIRRSYSTRLPRRSGPEQYIHSARNRDWGQSLGH